MLCYAMLWLLILHTYLPQTSNSVSLVPLFSAALFFLQLSSPLLFISLVTFSLLPATPPSSPLHFSSFSLHHPSFLFFILLFFSSLFLPLLLPSHHFCSLHLLSPLVPFFSSSPANMWSCPHHKMCVGCGKSAQAVGFLFRCTMCPNAHCEDCRGADQEVRKIVQVNLWCTYN